ncbi:hypothetical protein EON62_01180 [archaeon]|nr:MAG: hypothetical protein EON62_01180 [archaeon]
MSKGELAKLFREFAEDFNTVTLPHDKYYDMAAWESSEAARRGSAAAAAASKSVGSMSMLEEDARRRERAAEAAQTRKTALLTAYMKNMSAERLNEMKAQQSLVLAMQYAFKMGNTKEADRIKKLLEPDPPARGT